MAEVFIRRDLPLFILFICGLIMIVPYFFPNPVLLGMKSELGTWTIIIANTSILLGLIYMAYGQYRMLQRDRTFKGYFFFATPFAAFVISLLAAIAFPGYTSSSQYSWIFNNIYQMQVAMYVSLPLFYCYSAAYRTFTVASIESVALLLGGIIYAMRQIPLFLYLFPPLLDIGEWIVLVPNVGGGRAAVICVALGSIVIGLRTLAGREVTTIEVR